MSTHDTELLQVLDDLIGVLHTQAKELERLMVHVEGSTSPLPEATQMPVVVSQLSELHHRVGKLRASCGE